MKNKIINMIGDSIKDLNVYVDDVFEEKVEGSNILNIVLDSDEVIDLEKVTKASRIINKILDKDESIFENIDELDIYSKEKGE